MERERVSWWSLTQVPGIGPKRFYKLVATFGSAERAWLAEKSQLEQVLPKGVVEQFITFRNTWDPVPHLARYQKRGIVILTLIDPAYPINLKEIIDPPPVLYMLGQIQEQDRTALAVVGSRKATPYGRSMAHRFGQELVEVGFTVVSGMARGVDTAAHQGALRAQGRTIAVLGCGLDYVYPPENRSLMEKIAGNGAVVSEFPLGTRPEGRNFPIRNRIISGLSLGVLVVEAAPTSGSLITVDWALEQGREVFAVPGNINSGNSQGTNHLIRQGARLVENAGEIAEELELPVVQVQKPSRVEVLSREEEEVLAVFQDRHIHIDEVIQTTRFTAQQVAAILVVLELKGWVQQLPGKMYVKTG